MSMSIIIDGYNVIHADETLKRLFAEDMELARQRMIERIIGHFLSRKVHIIVIFDGMASSNQRINRFLTIAYSAAASSADALILKYIRKSRNPRSITVITSDRDLRNNIAALGAKTKSATDFLQDLTHEPPRPNRASAPEKPLTEKEIDDWVAFFKKPRQASK